MFYFVIFVKNISYQDIQKLPWRFYPKFLRLKAAANPLFGSAGFPFLRGIPAEENIALGRIVPLGEPLDPSHLDDLSRLL